MRDLANGQRRGQRGVFEHGNEVVAERRQHDPYRLWQDDIAHGLAVRHAQRARRLHLPFANRFDSGPEHFRLKRPIGQRQPKNHAGVHLHIADGYVEANRRQAIHKQGEDHKGNVQQLHQDRHATNGLYIEGSDVVQNGIG